MNEKYMVEALAAMAAMSTGQTTYKQFWESMPKSFHKIQGARRRKTVLGFSALQLMPELQHHSIRLQVLSMLAFLYCDGKGELKKETYRKAFKLAENLLGATMEDPPEDVFCANICSDRGKFLILETTDEDAGFLTQRLVNVVSGMPSNDDYEKISRAQYFLF